MANAGTKGRYIFRSWKVWGDGPRSGETGVCFKETLWGNNQVRWVWLRFEDGGQRAFAPSYLLRVDAQIR